MTCLLIVDDDPEIRRTLVAFFEDEGFSARSAANAGQALALLGEGAFEVAVVDIRLPGIDGGTLIERMMVDYPQLRVLVHTGSIDYVPSRRLRDLGLTDDDILTKPVLDMSRFVRAVKERVDNDRQEAP